ncbi:N-acetyl-gamma-glutamyl-phosphate reductase [Neisseria wadsworthii]|uniref:N-acetyl-gamma-glutamyl-phosphate reductase n=1 Tax=Neisseria wadsworthii 9715 TaxID=1030841 RepID=G4CRU2_9NEIS|nr:N-acetyl-gamma-glutamyl-phosphate reductase [Neisseria wadsworthii]EGZ45073.1 N-acetyl-gamma-glutamyl-phosphate reductase [Neisseria wadsworthii 9715]QMT35475.1 N-acetyl-gamma-glutamyl-phosphate reductase [Neisseria wadsworthii]
MAASQKIKIGIVGATGYTGVELLRLLASHPHAEVSVVTSRGEAGVHIADYFPSLRGVYDLVFQAPDEADLAQCDTVFFATPHGVTMKEAPALLEKGVRVIDLSADFRLQDVPAWEKWYKHTHSSTDILKEAVYGLCEMNHEAIRKARLIAVPGCYPTCVSLPLLPLLKAEALQIGKPLIADCKSGVSGAGRGASVGTLLCEAGDNFKAYGVAGHRHLPEIKQTINQLQSGVAEHFVFVPHLTPMIRGMHATIYVHLQENLNPHHLLSDFYSNSKFVDVMPYGSTPETRSVRGANICRISVQRAPESDVWILMSVQDNLVKGAAGQAVQNLNIMFGFAEDAGLQAAPLLP